MSFWLLKDFSVVKLINRLFLP